jgi:hypothetical protein
MLDDHRRLTEYEKAVVQARDAERLARDPIAYRRHAESVSRLMDRIFGPVEQYQPG